MWDQALTCFMDSHNIKCNNKQNAIRWTHLKILLPKIIPWYYPYWDEISTFDPLNNCFHRTHKYNSVMESTVLFIDFFFQSLKKPRHSYSSSSLVISHLQHQFACVVLNNDMRKTERKYLSGKEMASCMRSTGWQKMYHGLLHRIKQVFFPFFLFFFFCSLEMWQKG